MVRAHIRSLIQTESGLFGYLVLFPSLLGKGVLFNTIHESRIVIEWVIYFSELLILIGGVLIVLNGVRVDGHHN